MHRTRLNIVLALVLAGLGAGVYFSQKKEEKKPPLTALVPENVAQILVEHPGAPAIKLEKRGGTWLLTQPVTTEADKFEVNGVLSLASLEQKKNIRLTEVKLADLGLDPPQYTVTLDNTKLLVGGLEPLQFQRYIKLGDVIALTDDPPSAALDQDYSDLVSKSLLPEGAEIQKIEVPGLSMERAADGTWKISPADAKAGADQMQQFAQGWIGAKSLWNEFDAAAKSVKGDPVTITLKDRTLKFVIVSRDPQLQLERVDIGVRFNLSKALADDLLKLPVPVNPATPPTSAPPATENK